MRNTAQSSDEPAGLAILLDSDFWRLGVGVRDSPARIVEIATDAGAHRLERAETARLALTNPRARVQSEVAWLPGVAPSRAKHLVECLASGEFDAASSDGLPMLAKAALEVSKLNHSLSRADGAGASRILSDTLRTIDAVDVQDVLRDINEDRLVAAIPPVRDTQFVEAAWDEQKRRFNLAVLRALDGLPTDRLIETISRLAQFETQGGTVSGGLAVRALLAAYTVRASEYLDRQARAISELASAIVDNPGASGEALRIAVSRLELMLRSRDRVLQPIRKAALGVGRVPPFDRDMTEGVRLTVRRGLIDRGKDPDLALSLVDALLKTAFGMPEWIEALTQDRQWIVKEGAARAGTRRPKAEDVYAARLGFWRKVLILGERDLMFKGNVYAYERVRSTWASTATRSSAGTISTACRLLLDFDGRRHAVHTTNAAVFQEITKRLWSRQSWPALQRLCRDLKTGKSFAVGNILLADHGIRLGRSKFPFRPETRGFKWDELQCWSSLGAFHVAAGADERFHADAMFGEHLDTPIVAYLIKQTLDKKFERVSQIGE